MTGPGTVNAGKMRGQQAPVCVQAGDYYDDDDTPFDVVWTSHDGDQGGTTHRQHESMGDELRGWAYHIPEPRSYAEDG